MIRQYDKRNEKKQKPFLKDYGNVKRSIQSQDQIKYGARGMRFFVLLDILLFGSLCSHWRLVTIK